MFPDSMNKYYALKKIVHNHLQLFTIYYLQIQNCFMCVLFHLDKFIHNKKYNSSVSEFFHTSHTKICIQYTLHTHYVSQNVDSLVFSNSSKPAVFNKSSSTRSSTFHKFTHISSWSVLLVNKFLYTCIVSFNGLP